MKSFNGQDLKVLLDKKGPANPRAISLQSLGVEYLEPRTFEKCSQLEELDLRCNSLGYVDELTFFGCVKLEKLDLDQNLIYSLDRTMLSGCPNLTELNLSSNEISIFSESTFRDHAKIRTLNLASNKLRQIDETTFYWCHQLTSLNLSGNRIISIHKWLFTECTSLTELRLDSNQISELHPDTFEHCVNLAVLSLASNKLKFVDPDLLLHCTRIKTVFLHGNLFDKALLFLGSNSLENIQVGRLLQAGFSEQPRFEFAILICADSFQVIDSVVQIDSVFEFYEQADQIKSMIEHFDRRNELVESLQELAKRNKIALLDRVLSVNSSYDLFDVDNSRDELGRSLLDFSISNGHTDPVFLLCSHDADLDRPDTSQAFHLALKNQPENQIGILKILLRFTKDWEEAFRVIAEDGSIDSLKLGSLARSGREITNLVFQGGGVKGIAYLGALRTLVEEQQVICLRRMKRFGGTSAGSICACLLGVGYSLEELEHVLKFKLNMADLLDGDDEYKAEFFKLRKSKKFELAILALKLSIQYSKTKRGAGAIEHFMAALLQLFKTFKITKLQENMLKRRGIFSGRVLRSTIDLLIREKTGRFNTTFGQLDELVREEPTKFKHIFVTGVDLTTQRTFVFSHLHSRDVAIADAVRCSVSIPIVFEPFKLEFKDSEGANVSGLFVDGGIFDNYPLWLFDNCQYLNDFNSNSGHMVHNHETLGFRLISSEFKELLEKSREASQRSDSCSDASILPAFLRCLASSTLAFAKQDSDHHRQKEDRARTVYIETGSISTLDFDLSDDQKQELIESGKRGALDFCFRAQL